MKRAKQAFHYSGQLLGGLRMAICIDGFRCPNASADIDPNYNRVHVLNQGAFSACVFYYVLFFDQMWQCMGLAYTIFGVDYNILHIRLCYNYSQIECSDDYSESAAHEVNFFRYTELYLDNTPNRVDCKSIGPTRRCQSRNRGFQNPGVIFHSSGSQDVLVDHVSGCFRVPKP
jgi:hypothetical protein